jgi:hypothetical protein
VKHDVCAEMRDHCVFEPITAVKDAECDATESIQGNRANNDGRIEWAEDL